MAWIAFSVPANLVGGDVGNISDSAWFVGLETTPGSATYAGQVRCFTQTMAEQARDALNMEA